MSDLLTVRARLAAPVETVRNALTDPAELRVWLAEHAEVELPRRYEFWGRYTPEGAEPHQRLLHADERTLRFAWTLDGVETTTEFELTPEDKDTLLTLRQSHFSFEEAMSGSSIRGVLQTFWALAIANLNAHLEGRPLLPRTDFTSADLRGELLIDAPMDKVWTSLTDSEQASAWFGFPIGIEPWVGGRYAMGGFDAGYAAKVVDLTPGRALSVDWGPTGVSTWELAESGGRTKLTFVQSGFDETNPPYAAWTGSVAGLAELRRFHEMADWQPIWLAEEMPSNA
ncbi:SRPBCC domain-containing protein [Micromonospora terminaliae]|uniref:SRPBCC domain-containing protein n=1 Tax=Micromonospora terminaliae TaxID=1914461 RepID=A0AAJ3DLB7_9ACTN|nr:SRPBCC family protein [Micromonospora terminaliae]NES30752.1 SRPBCC domain-containing protein [Micromonospora terminaliae]QGL51045.1 SRPBCC domain-containing protein [Micromonospora terminaliae]